MAEATKKKSSKMSGKTSAKGSVKRSVKKSTIIEFGNPILRKKAPRVSKKYINTPEFKQIIKKLYKACEEYEGVGIAAPQIGISKRIFVIDVHKTTMRTPEVEVREVVINPVIIESGATIVSDWEGCLSLPGVMGKVPRPENVTVEYMNKNGDILQAQFGALVARIVQHETDHLDGIFYTDRMTDMSTLMTSAEVKKLNSKKVKKKSKSSKTKSVSSANSKIKK